ncbi:unnamed protein product [Owenia fusiformis]|uniref:non-specific serine/threonine protein kinase n=1 Tax=Owenia fusiformis TaxID=6347 RepID=A0A8S4NB84_OWEFU|nr:unnamed protein product [Owenia fusiformis]
METLHIRPLRPRTTRHKIRKILRESEENSDVPQLTVSQDYESSKVIKLKNGCVASHSPRNKNAFISPRQQLDLIMSQNGYDDTELLEAHFPTFEDRVRSRSSRSGRASPTHSAHGSLFRHTLTQSSRRARKVRFYRNGDRFFKGMIYAVSPERFRTFESLMAELTRSPLCDNNILPKGVRYVFTLNGNKRVSNLDELEEGESYVCASTGLFKNIDYNRGSNPNWNPNVKSSHEGTDKAALATSLDLEDDSKDFIKPRLVTIIRNGSKPRKAVRVLLNKKTAHSFDQVLNDINDAIKFDGGYLKKVYSITGKPINCLPDFFKDDNVFIAYGPEKYSLDDFDLDDNEVKFVSAYRSVRQKERITLKSPKAPRRVHSTVSPSQSGMDLAKIPSSPRSARRMKPKVPAKPKLTNGVHKTNGVNGHTSPTGDKNLPAKLTDFYAIGKIIGEGNFAVVKECVSRIKKKAFALKIIDKTKCKGKEQMIENEVSILRRVKHPNIILLVEDFDTATELYLVMELVKGGDLFMAISTLTKYTEQDASGMIYNLASAVKYLHSLNIVHRDVKPENLLVCEHEDGSKSLKLGDFGLATEVQGPLFTVCGTPTYVAPEVLTETGYGLKIDVWASGVITYILLCGFPPFVSATNNQDELFDLVMEAKFEFTSPFWDGISDSAKELISKMLLLNPGDRYSAAQVLDHPWVADDTAKDCDMHVTVSREMSRNFEMKVRSSSNAAGIAVIASTALDKSSKFFNGRKIGLQVQTNGDQEEVF